MLVVTNLVWAWSWRHEDLLCHFRRRRRGISADAERSCLFSHRYFKEMKPKINKKNCPVPKALLRWKPFHQPPVIVVTITCHVSITCIYKSITPSANLASLVVEKPSSGCTMSRNDLKTQNLVFC